MKAAYEQVQEILAGGILGQAESISPHDDAASPHPAQGLKKGTSGDFYAEAPAALAAVSTV